MPKSALPVRSTAPKGGNSMSYGQLLQAVNNKQDEVDKLKSSYQGSVPSSQHGITTKPVDSQTTQSAVAQETGVKAGRGSGEVLDSYYEKRDAAAGKVTEPAPAISGSTKNALTDKNTDSTVKNTLLSYYSKRQDESASVIRNANPKPTQTVDETAKQLFTGAKSFVNNYITNNTYKSPSGNTNPSLSEYAYNRMQNDPTGYRKDVGDKVYGAVQKELSGEHGRAQDVIEGTAQRYVGNALNSLTSFENYALNSASDNATPAGVTDYAWNLVQNNSDAELRKQLGDKQYDMLMKAINNANIPKQREQANARRAKADNLILEGNQKVEGAKEGLGTLGQLGVDAASSGLEIFGDVLATAVTGGASLLPLGMRAMGGSEYSARQAGASEGQAIAFGVASGALEAMTERMFDFGGALRTAYGPAWSGTLDAYGKNFVEQTSRKIAKSEFGQKLAYALGMRVIGAGGEAAEEVVSGIIEPLLEKAIYNPDAKIDPMEVLHSATVGGLVGGLLGGGNILTTSVYHNDLVVNSLVDIAKANNDPKSSVYKFADTLGKANQAGQAVTGQEVSDLLELMADTAGEGATKNLYALAGIEKGSKNAQVKLDMAVADALTTVSEAITDPTTASAKVEELQKDVRILSNAMVSEEVPDSIKPYLADAIRKADANTNLRAVMGAVRVTPTAETASAPNSMGEIGVRRGDTVSYHASQAAQESVPESVIGYDVMRKHDNGSVDYVFVDDFNNNPYPQITRQVTMDANGNMRDTTPSKPTIINDKSTLVAPDYTGFNVQEQKANETYWKEGRKRTGLSYNTTQMSNKAYFDNYMNTLKQAELRRENNERFASVIQNQGRETLIYYAEGSSPLSGERVDGYVESRAAEATERINTYGEKGTVGKRAKSVLSLMNALKKQGAQPMDAREFLGEQGAEGTAVIPVTGKAASRFANLTSRLKAQGFKEVKYFAGELIVHDGNRLGSVNGAVDVENGIVYLCVDDPLYAASQIADHELFHKIVDDNRSLMDAALKAITDSGKQEAFKKASADYMDAYAGTGANGAQVLEELLCDAYAGINIFMYSEGADAENAKVGAEQFHNEVVAAVQAAEQATATEEITEAPVETTETTEDIVTESTEEGVNPEVSSQNETAETTEENVNPAAETQETTAETTEAPVETEERATAETEETTEPIRIRRDRGGEWEEVSKDDAIAFAKELYGNLRNMKDAGKRLAMVNGEIQGYTITADDIGAEAQTETKPKAAEVKVDKATNEEIDRLASMDENQEIWAEPNAKLVFTGKEKSPEKYKWEVVEERPNGQVIHQFFTAKKNAQAFAKAQNEKSGANAAIVVDLTKSGALEKALDASIAANEYGGDVEYKAAPKKKQFSRRLQKIATEGDRLYDDALQRGDMEDARKQVLEAASHNGYITANFYHGTDNFGFTTFDTDKTKDKRSIFVTSSPYVAESYSKSTVYGTPRRAKGENFDDAYDAIDGVSYDDIETMSAEQLADLANKWMANKESTTRGSDFDVINREDAESAITFGIWNGFSVLSPTLELFKMNLGIANSKAVNDAFREYYRAVSKMNNMYSVDGERDNAHWADDYLPAIRKSAQSAVSAISDSAKDGSINLDDLIVRSFWDVQLELAPIIQGYETLAEYQEKDGTQFIQNKRTSQVYSESQLRDELEGELFSFRGNYVLFVNPGRTLDIAVDGKNWNQVPFDPYKIGERIPKALEKLNDVLPADMSPISERDLRWMFRTGEVTDKMEHALTHVSSEVREEVDTLDKQITEYGSYGNGGIDYKRGSKTRAVSEFADKNGYDSVLFRNIYDTGWNSSGIYVPSDIYVLFNPSQVKSADTIVYDDDGNIIPPSERFNEENNDIRFSRKLTDAQEEFFKDSKARDESGNLLELYHGGRPYGDENVFGGRSPEWNRTGIYLTDDPYVAKAFGADRVYSLYANIKRPLVLDAQGRNYTDIPIPDNAPPSLKNYYMMTETADADSLPFYAKEHGYDGVIIRNVREGVGGYPMTDVIAFDANQVKNVDNENPTESDDIRFSRVLTPQEEETLADADVAVDEDTRVAYPDYLNFSRKTFEESRYVTDKKEAAKILANNIGITIKQATKYIDDINSIAAKIASDPTRWDYTSAEGMSSYMDNAEYVKTIDFSTICTKRRLYSGTFSAIQKAMPNTVFTENDMMEIRRAMVEARLEAPCVMCFVESSRIKMGEYAHAFIEQYKKANPNAEWIPDMYDVNTPEGAEAMRLEHPDVYEWYNYFWNTQGRVEGFEHWKETGRRPKSFETKGLFSAQGKAKLFQSATAYDGELIKVYGGDYAADLKTIEDAEETIGKLEAEYNKAVEENRTKKEQNAAKKKVDEAKKAVEAATKRVDRVNKINLFAGIRMQSFSDFEVIHLIDAMQVVMDLSAAGLKSHAYTKVGNFARALGNTGVKINLSLVAKGVDENGKLTFNEVEGMKWSEVEELRKQYPKNVGDIVVTFNDAQLKAAMADERIDFIIPFHRSQWTKKQFDRMGLGTNSKDYAPYQKERWLDSSKHIKFDENGKPELNENGKPVKKKIVQIPPMAYWDFSKSGKENAERYLELCAKGGTVNGYEIEGGRRPKFYKLLTRNSDGSFSLPADGSADGYWKLLIDFKMYDNDGKGAPFENVVPAFNMEAANEMMDEYQGGHQSLPVAQEFADNYIEKYKKEHPGKVYSRKFSTPAVADAVAENEYAKQNITSFNDSESSQARLAAVNPNTVARNIAKQYKSSVNITTMQAAVNELKQYAQDRISTGKTVDYDDAKMIATTIARQVVMNNPVLTNTDGYKAYAKMMKFINNAKISIPPGVSRYIDNYQAWKTDNIDNIHVASNGIPVKNAYQALQNGFGKEAFPDGLKQYEQAMRIADVVGNYRNIYENPYTYNVDLASQFVANDILNSVFKSPDTREIGSADLASLYEAINDRRENMMNEVGRAYADGEDINIATTESANEDVAYKHANLPHDEWSAGRTKGNKETKTASPTDIIARMQAKFGFNITEGHIRNVRALGVFYRNNKGIRLENDNDIATASHELGHALDQKFQIIAHLTDAMKDELMHNHTLAVQDLIARYPESQQLGEAIAEYNREFFRNKDSALSQFPEFSKYYLNAMDEDTRANMLAMADVINNYYVEASKSAESSVHFRSEGSPDYRPWQVKLQRKGDRLYQMWVDTNRAIYRFSQATGSNAYILATNAAYADARAGQVLVGQLFDKDGYYVSEGLTAALNDIDLNNNKEYKAFGEYLVVKHGPEFKAETGGDVFANPIQNTESWMENRAKELEEQYPQFKKAAEKLYKFQTEFLRVYGVETGLISQDTFDNWTQNYVTRTYKNGKVERIPVRIENDKVFDLNGKPFELKGDDVLHKARWQYYVPFNRVLTNEAGLGYKMGSSAKRGFANQTGTFKKAHGSTKDIYHPVDNIMMNIIKVVKAGLSNQVMLEIADTAKKYNIDANIMAQDDEPMERREFYAMQLKESLKRQAEKGNKAGKITDESLDTITNIIDNIDDILVQYQRGQAFGNKVVVLRNGQEEYWKINDPFLLESLTKMNPNRAGGLLETYSVISKFMTSNITGNNLIWSLSRNAPKDIGTAINYSPTKNPIKLFGGIASAYKNSLKNAVGIEVDPYYQEYLAMGGGKTSAYSADIDTADRVRRSMRKKTVEKTPKGLFNKIFAEPIELVSDTVELGPRYATYKALRDSGMSPQEAFFEACDVTVNFRRGGWMARQVNKATPFFNANVQGIDKFVRYFTAAGVAPADKAKVLAGRATFFVAQSALLAAITAALNYRDKDKEKDYEQLSSFTKNNYWCIPSDIANRLPVGFKLKQGEFLALPKPRELGLLSSFIERCVESYLGENEHAFEDFNTYVSDNLLPAYLSDLTDAAFDDQKSIFEGFETMPTNVGIFGVFAYLHANKDFLGRNIVSESLLKYERKDQFNGRTSIPAYYIGQAFNLSPQKIDFLGNQIFSNVWKPMQAMFPKDDFYKDKSLGIRNAWVKDSQYSNDLINWMYDEAESSERANNSAHRENGEKAYRKAMDDKMKSFYSNYYSLTKELDETADSREYRQAVLDMIDDYRSSIEHGIPYSQQAVHDVVVRANNTELLPASIGTTIKDASGKELQLTYQQYYNYQTLYTGYYYDLANEAFSYLPNQADRELALKKIKGNSDNTPAKTMAMDDILVGMGKDPTGKLDKYQDVRMADVIVWSVFCDKADAAGVSVDDDGVVKNNGSVDQKEARYALDQMTWLSEHEKAVLWNSKWSTVKNNPWKKYL